MWTLMFKRMFNRLSLCPGQVQNYLEHIHRCSYSSTSLVKSPRPPAYELRIHSHFTDVWLEAGKGFVFPQGTQLSGNSVLQS